MATILTRRRDEGGLGERAYGASTWSFGAMRERHLNDLPRVVRLFGRPVAETGSEARAARSACPAS